MIYNLTTTNIKTLSLIFSLFMTIGCSAKSFNGLDNFLSKEFQTNTEQNHQSAPKETLASKVKTQIPQDKKNNFIVSWSILKEYDLKTDKIGVNLKKIVNKNIVIKGFMIPLDYSAKKIKEFLLVPYMPSCAHVPPPAANNIIKVTMDNDSEINPSYWPVQVVGKLKLGKGKKMENGYMTGGAFQLFSSGVKELKK